tara:strand:+ start:89 stop:280 length:192 start_codon:yes stop_codon:yes gene_type:complete
MTQLEDSIFAHSSVGMSASIGSAVINYLNILNPILSTITLIIGISVGICTLIIKIKEIRGRNT